MHRGIAVSLFRFSSLVRRATRAVTKVAAEKKKENNGNNRWIDEKRRNVSSRKEKKKGNIEDRVYGFSIDREMIRNR